MTEAFHKYLGLAVLIILLAALIPSIVTQVNTAYTSINGVSCSEGSELFGDDFDGEDVNPLWAFTEDYLLTEAEQQNGNASVTVSPRDGGDAMLGWATEELTDLIVDCYAKITNPELIEYLEVAIEFDSEGHRIYVSNYYADTNDYWLITINNDEGGIETVNTTIPVSTNWDHLQINYCMENKYLAVLVNGTLFNVSDYLLLWETAYAVSAELTEGIPTSVYLDNFHIYDAVCSGGVTGLTGGSGFLAMLLIIPFVFIVAVAYYVIRRSIENKEV